MPRSPPRLCPIKSTKASLKLHSRQTRHNRQGDGVPINPRKPRSNCILVRHATISTTSVPHEIHESFAQIAFSSDTPRSPTQRHPVKSTKASLKLHSRQTCHNLQHDGVPLNSRKLRSTCILVRHATISNTTVSH